MRVATKPLVVALTAFSLIAASPARADIYRWLDAAGTVHLDDDITRVPEAHRSAARVFQTKVVAQEEVSGPTQGVFANAVARDLGLQMNDLQDPVSILQIVGIYPSAGWHPQAALASAVVAEVATTARAAARANRLKQSPGSAEAAVLRVSAGLGVAGPPPTVVAEPAPPPQPLPPIVIAPQIIVEAPPPTVVVRYVEPAPRVLLSRYPTFAFGVPFATLPVPIVPGPIPERITPLANPAGRLHGPLIEPLRAGSFFNRPLGF